jgi:hypothetical protein
MRPWTMGKQETPSKVTWDKSEISFDSFLERTQTNAFLIIRDGAITYENISTVRAKVQFFLPIRLQKL